MTVTPNYEFPTEDARYPSLEAMIKTAMEKIDGVIKTQADTIEALDARVVVLEEAP